MAAQPVRAPDPHALLPLKQAHFLILVCLAEGERHGYALKKEIRQRTSGSVNLGAGTLYRSIRQLTDLGLIEESASRPEPAIDDERRQYFRITPMGRQVARAESERLAGLVSMAQAGSLHDPREPRDA